MNQQMQPTCLCSPGLPCPIHGDKHSEDAFYAAYANHCAIQRKIPLTYHSWKRAGRPQVP